MHNLYWLEFHARDLVRRRVAEADHQRLVDALLRSGPTPRHALATWLVAVAVRLDATAAPCDPAPAPEPLSHFAVAH